MKPSRVKIIALAIIVAVLCAAFCGCGNYATDNQFPDQSATTLVTENEQNASDPAGEKAVAAGDQTAVKNSGSQKNQQPTTVSPHSKNKAEQKADIDAKARKDQYQTGAVPAGKPEPVEPQEADVGKKAYTCTLSVRCDTILANIKRLDPHKKGLVPADGIIFPTTTVAFYEGESVFDLLQREMKKAGIHMEFVNTPIYNSAYIEGINNLYEFDCGELSGWMYKVNGWFPNYGCSRYQLQAGDRIEWVYTCDLGRDVGGDAATSVKP